MQIPIRLLCSYISKQTEPRKKKHQIQKHKARCENASFFKPGSLPMKHHIISYTKNVQTGIIINHQQLLKDMWVDFIFNCNLQKCNAKYLMKKRNIMKYTILNTRQFFDININPKYLPFRFLFALKTEVHPDKIITNIK